MSPPEKNGVMLRMIRGGRSTARENRPNFQGKKPLDESFSALLSMRKRNRLEIAERCHELHTKKRRGWAPHSDKKKSRDVEYASSCTGILKDFIEENEVDFKREAVRLVHKIRDGDLLGDHSKYAERLAMIASDPELCGKEASIAALKILVWESLIHYDMDTTRALKLMGWELEKMPRLEKAALLLPAPIRWFSKILRKTMKNIEWKLRGTGDEYAEG